MGSDLPTNGDPPMAGLVSGDPAWLAAFTGFEVQIDENAQPDNADKHRTGAIYDVPTGPGGLQAFTATPALGAGTWHDMEITVQAHRYRVSINGSQTTDFTNPLNDLVVVNPGLKLKQRGLPNNADPLSGYIGVQAHTANVGFRNIRIKRL
jgi:hypothetical protein